MDYHNDIMVSICCITYNQAQYIRQCLNGFLIQKTHFKFEVLIHDDASNDGTSEIIKEYESKYPHIIKPIYQSENKYSKGIGINAKYNWPRAKGRYIAFCEGDDYWIDPEKIQKQVDYLEKNESCGLVWTSAKVYDQESGLFIKDTIGRFANSFYDVIIKNPIITLTALCRTELILEYSNKIYPQIKCVIGDYPIWLYIAANHDIKFIDEVTSIYRYLNGSISRPKSKDMIYNYIMSENEIRLFFLNKYKEILSSKERVKIMKHEINRLINKSVSCDNKFIFYQALYTNLELHKDSFLLQKRLSPILCYSKYTISKIQNIFVTLKTYYVKNKCHINKGNY